MNTKKSLQKAIAFLFCWMGMSVLDGHCETTKDVGFSCSFTVFIWVFRTGKWGGTRKICTLDVRTDSRKGIVFPA